MGSLAGLEGAICLVGWGGEEMEAGNDGTLETGPAQEAPYPGLDS